MKKQSQKSTFGRPSDKMNPVHMLQQLRAFVGSSRSEAELLDCLKDCNYNIERAAELLITGQYQRGGSLQTKTNSSPPAAAIDSTTQSYQTHSVTKQGGDHSSTTQANTSFFAARKSITPKGSATTPNSFSAAKSYSCEASKSYLHTSKVIRNEILPNSWLLCQRWISDAVCTSRHGRIRYQEPLTVSIDSTGKKHTVRFRGASIEGIFPDNLACLLSPIDRHDPTLLQIQAEGLMDDQHMPIGRQLPLSVSIRLVNPKRFFRLFEAEDATTKTSMFFESRQQASSKRKLPLVEAAFQLLQWAEYGDVPEFHPPLAHEQIDEDDAIEMDEQDFEDASVAESTAEAKQWAAAIAKRDSSNDWASSLPESEDPEGFVKGVSLRPYQKQALFWMSKRENEGETKGELLEQLQLMSELSKGEGRTSKSTASGVQQGRKDIHCECGPVVLSEKAMKESMTVDGEVDPVSHPLWKRRFLASYDFSKSISFYVNEVLGIATHAPPEPPKPCSGGILSDAMGLGKTVMLLGLILKSKNEREARGICGPKTTLVVAKLSLLAQWEDELNSKTNLSHRVFYSDSSRGLSTSDLESLDVVVTTYGMIQNELKRKNQTLLETNWLRVILDEAHCIRNPKTLASKASCALNAKHRWCVSGTIIQNSLNDIFGVMKFLRHEPWCLPSFWKAAIERPSQAKGDGNAIEIDEPTGLYTALDRLRRVLTPIMIRRTKDSLTKDGQPILTLPPVETKIVKVNLSDSEREFYSAVHAKSIELFEGFVEAGTATSSYFQIFSLLQRLRQTCDHIALTVKTRIDSDSLTENDESDPTAISDQASVKEQHGGRDGIGQNFLDDLLSKFAAQRSPKKKRGSDPKSPTSKKVKDNVYLSQVAQDLSHAVENEATHFSQECAICLEEIKVDDAVVTPCAHIFCHQCLVGCLQEKAEKKETESKMMTNLRCPDGPCPVCNIKVDAKRIVVLSKSKDGVSTNFLSDSKPVASVHRPFQTTKPTNDAERNNFARRTLENAISGCPSSKMNAIMSELDVIWQMDPGSKILIFSQYLGFLDLLQIQFRRESIPFFRLDGSCTLKQRYEILEAFRTSDNRTIGKENDLSQKRGTVMLMSMAAGAEGLNLVSASSVFIVDPWWNAAREDQCVNRIHRIGQKADLVRVRKFVVTDSVEERILELQGRKKYVAEEIYNDEGREIDVSGAQLSLDEFRLIFHK